MADPGYRDEKRLPRDRREAELIQALQHAAGARDDVYFHVGRVEFVARDLQQLMEERAQRVGVRAMRVQDADATVEVIVNVGETGNGVIVELGEQ